MKNQLLYPKTTKTRQVIDLSGLWSFDFDYESNKEELYKNGFKSKIEIPVPSSFQDYFDNVKEKEYTGDFFYQTTFYADKSWKDRNIDLRFAAATHRAKVYLNGTLLGSHEGGFLPFGFTINDIINYDDINTIVVKMNNELSFTSLPAGDSKVLKDGRKITTPFFDFFNYSGLIRPVKIVLTPKTYINDITLTHKIVGKDTITSYNIESFGGENAEVLVYDEEGNLVSQSSGLVGDINIKNTKLWRPLDAYLYHFVFNLKENDEIVDTYFLEVGIRTVEIKGNSYLINNEPVYFKGFGKHEDAHITGRGFNLPVIKRDFMLMKWIGANSFRTSHYPYSEEIYDIADREGIMVIDELASVGMLVSTRNAVDAATNAKVEPFFDKEIVQTKTLENHLNQLEELVKRDKNHACVVAWSLFNEPDTVNSDKAVPYFETIFDKCKELDPQKRPRSFASIIGSSPSRCLCNQFTDFIMLNRYYGWYLMGGAELEDAFDRLDKELDEWELKEKPIMFTEYGTDNLQGLTTLPATQWSENYQIEYLKGYHKVFDKHDSVIGEQVWNFADFRTTEGIIRVNGNKKGIFTREREPKMAAFYLKERWESLPLNYKRKKD